MANLFGPAFFTGVEFLALLFFVIGTPIDMFRLKDIDSLGNTNCVTMWGFKEKCHSTTYDVTFSKALFDTCESRYNYIVLTQACSLITIAAFLICFFFALLACCCTFRLCCCRVLIFIISIVGTITGAIAWGSMVTIYLNNQSDDFMVELNVLCSPWKLIFKYGAGFALLVTGWCLHAVNGLILLLPCVWTDPKSL